MKSIKLEYCVMVGIVADKRIDKGTDLRQALMNSIYANRCLFNVSESGELLKYKNRIAFVYDSYAEFVVKIESDIKYYLKRDLNDDDAWNVQVTIERQEWATPI